MESPVISLASTSTSDSTDIDIDVIDIEASSSPERDTEHTKANNTDIAGSSSLGDSEVMGMVSSSTSRDIYDPVPQPEGSRRNGPPPDQFGIEDSDAGLGASELRRRHKRKARNEQPSGDHEFIDLTGDEDGQSLERVTSKTGTVRRRTSAGGSSIRAQLGTGHEHGMGLGHSASGRPRRFQASASGDITVVTEPSSRRPSGPVRNSSFVLPRWQPDAEATYCPVCSTQFNFFVRKHHCRKCGRVVCSVCSPHRITIPYSFIVQPDLSLVRLAQRNRGSIYVPHNTDGIAGLGGGEKVRICNTCVEMPSDIPPGEHDRRDSGLSGRSSHRHDRALSNEQARARFQGASEVDAFPTRASPRSETMSAQDFIMRLRSGTVATESQADPQAYPGRLGHNPSHSLASSTIMPLGYDGSRGRSFIDYGTYQGRVSASDHSGPATGSNPQPHYRSLLDPNRPSNAAQSDLSRPLPAAPHIAEEDECPVCHRELPSRTLNDFERLREEHINDCILRQISVHSGTVRPGAYTYNPQPSLQNSPIPPTHSNSPPSSASTPVADPAPILDTPEARTAARERAHAAVVLGLSGSSGTTSPGGPNQRLTGMFPYTATEKDCVDDAECTICLEEFEVGVGMARLECLCRFHRKCIRNWFKGHPGECPVHRMMGMN